MNRRLLLDGRALEGHSSVRGIGTYLRGLLGGLAELGVTDRIDLLLRRGRPLPAEARRLGVAGSASVPTVKRRLQPLLDPLLVMPALRGHGLYHAVEWAQPLRSRIPVVVTVHDLIPFLFPRWYPWLRRERLLALRQLPHADAIIAVSRCTADDVVRLAGVDPQRVTVIHLGVDPGFRPAPADVVEPVLRGRGVRRPYLLAVGTHDDRKRIEVVAEVAARARRDHGAELVVAGEQGVYRPRVEAAVAAAGIGDSTRLLGFVGVDELVALYSGAECLVFPSAYEGFGLPVLEAMACGAPAVVFDNSAMPEVAGDAALVVADGDAAAMAEAVSRLLGDPTDRERHAAAGRAWAASFARGRSAAAHLDVYRSLGW